MTRLSVVILNYNGEKLLQQFLPGVLRYSVEAEVIVADNGSTDQSLSLLKREFPDVRVIALDQNYGFCGGYNRALKQVDADYFLLLNSDIEVTPGWLQPILQLFERYPHIAAIQPKILSWHDKSKFEYAGAGGGLIDTLGYPFCRGRVFDHVEEDQGQYNDEHQIFWATGACMAIRSAVYRTFKGLDEYLFAHMEEIDLCWKINRTEQSVWYTGKSTVYHVGAGTLGYENPFKTYLNFRNGLILIWKHLDSVELFYKFPLRLALDWLAALVFLASRKGKNALSVFKAHRDFFKDLGKHWRKREEIQQSYPSYSRKNIHPGLIVFDYYLRKRKTVKKSIIPDRTTFS
jgi:GT2 family glycosyltransferase